MKLTCLIASLFLSIRLFSQVVQPPGINGYAGMGAYSAHFTDPYSFSSNQAALAQLNNVVAGIMLERRFLLKELQQIHAVAAFPFRSGGMGVDLLYGGSKLFSQSRLGLAYGRKLGKQAQLGIQLNYNRLSIPTYGSAAAITFEIGAVFQLSPQLYSGIHLDNPVGGTLSGNTGEKMASVYTWGIALEASDQLLISVQLNKEENKMLDVMAAIDYAFLPRVSARAGISTATSHSFAGIGLLISNMRFDFVADWHARLGLTPILLFIMTFGEPKTETS